MRDYPPIAKNAVTILINLSTDREILEALASDDVFLETLLSRLTNPNEPNANELSMLLANLAKWDHLKRIVTLERPVPEDLKSNKRAIDQLVDLFVKGADGTFNKHADFDYLAYLFADIAKHAEGRQYFLSKQEYDSVIPLMKLTVFTEHKSDVRRKGVASTIKNVAFEVPEHPKFLDENEINILPYLLLPITGNEEYDEEDMLEMLPDLQLLPPDKARDSDHTIIQTHIETLMLLTTTREGRDLMRQIKVYPVIRETHLHVENDDVREACERLVQVLMRDEEGEEKVDTGMKALTRGAAPKRLQAAGGPGSWAMGGRTEEVEVENGRALSNDDNDDDKIVEV